MISRLVAALVLVPVAVILISLAVANRDPAGFTIDPFNPGNPALTLELPLFVWLFAALALGMIVGSTATWFRQRKYRRAAKDGLRETAVSRDLMKSKPEAPPAPGERTLSPNRNDGKPASFSRRR